MPKASIIITTHNRSSFVIQAINSAKNSGDDVEVIVVDDASTDNTQEICNSISGIKYIRLERNQRTAGARNVGIVASSSPLIAFLDDDDWRLPGSMDLQISILEKDPSCGLVYGQYLSATQDGEILIDSALPIEFPEGDVFWDLLAKNFIGCLTAVFRKECLYSVGLLDTSPEMYGIEDLDLWIRIAELYSVRAVKQPVAVYRIPDKNSKQWSSNQTNQLSLIEQAYKNKWLKLPRMRMESSNDVKRKKDAFLFSISETMMYDMAHNTEGLKAQLNKISKAVKCYPSQTKRLVFYKTVVKTILSKGKKA